MLQRLELHKTDTLSLRQKAESCNLLNHQKGLVQVGPVQCSKMVKMFLAKLKSHTGFKKSHEHPMLPFLPSRLILTITIFL